MAFRAVFECGRSLGATRSAFEDRAALAALSPEAAALTLPDNEAIGALGVFHSHGRHVSMAYGGLPGLTGLPRLTGRAHVQMRFLINPANIAAELEIKGGLVRRTRTCAEGGKS